MSFIQKGGAIVKVGGRGCLANSSNLELGEVVTRRMWVTWKAVLVGVASCPMAEAAAMAWGVSAGTSMATRGTTPPDSQTRSPVLFCGVPFARSCSAHAAPACCHKAARQLGAPD